MFPPFTINECNIPHFGKPAGILGGDTEGKALDGDIVEGQIGGGSPEVGRPV